MPTSTAGAPRSFYSYDPVEAAAGVACGLYAVGFIISLFQTIKARAWIWFVMLLAILMEVVGYGARAKSAADVTSKDIYIVQFCLTILAPVLMAGVIYVVFGRIVFHVVPEQARTTRLLWVPPRFVTPIFVGFDIFALFLQLVGAVMVSATEATDKNAKQKIDQGRNLALAGVTVQIIAFGLFSIIAARFHFTSRRFREDMERRYQSSPGDKLVTLAGSDRKYKPNWRGLLYAVNASCVLILVRSIYREVEFGQGKTGYTTTHEWCLYVFDTIPMFIVVVVYALYPPGAYVAMGWRQRLASVRRLVSSDSSKTGTYVLREQGRQQV